MGQKDLSQKNLEMYPDVFADIMNALLHEGKKILKDNQLCPAPTETIYGAGRKKLKNQFQDVGMDELRDGRIHTKYMLENQTQIDRRLPMRKAGYHGVIYKRQYAEKQYAEKQVYPVVGLVLYWGKKTWKPPYSLKALFTKDEETDSIMDYVDDVQLHVYEMAHLKKEVRERFHSDMRVIVDYLAEGVDYRPSRQRLRHPEEVLLFLSALTHDIRYEEIIEEVKEMEEPKMCELIDKYEKRGEKKGIRIGKRLGRAEGREQGSAREIVSFGEELNWPMEEILGRLMQRLNIREQKAQEYYNAYKGC